MKKAAACVFPGQGAQRPNMGRDYYDDIPVSRQTYEEASDALGWNVADLCFNEDERLNLTEYTQPCILATEIAALRGLQSLYGFSPSIFGGHSLGEFTALVAADALPFAEALRIVHIRGKLMQKAVPIGVGGMAAVISQHLGMDAVCRSLTDIPVDVANVNSAHQVVISGMLDALPKAEKRLQNALAHDQGFRFVPLNVSAPFHSRFMKPIEESFTDALRSVEEKIAPGNATRVTSNFSGQFHIDKTESIIQGLVSQLSNTVRWTDNMKCIAAKTDLIYEIGPSRPLRDFFKTIDANCVSIINLSTARRIFGENN